jgi:hypothetical protein
VCFMALLCWNRWLHLPSLAVMAQQELHDALLNLLPPAVVIAGPAQVHGMQPPLRCCPIPIPRLHRLPALVPVMPRCSCACPAAAAATAMMWVSRQSWSLMLHSGAPQHAAWVTPLVHDGDGQDVCMGPRGESSIFPTLQLPCDYCLCCALLPAEILLLVLVLLLRLDSS